MAGISRRKIVAGQKRKNPRIIFRLTADDLRSLKGRLGLKMTGNSQSKWPYPFLNDVLLKEGDLSRLDFLELPFNAEILKDTNEIRFELAQSQVASELDRRVISISIEEIHLD